MSLYEIFKPCYSRDFSHCCEDLLFPMWVMSMIFFLSLGMRNCSHCWSLRLNTKGIGFSNSVNMARSRMFFSNYVIMKNFLINSCLIQQIQGGCVVLLDLVHCSLFENEFDLTLFNCISFFFNTCCKCRSALNWWNFSF